VTGLSATDGAGRVGTAGAAGVTGGADALEGADGAGSAVGHMTLMGRGISGLRQFLSGAGILGCSIMPV
jgi:hypothetical protein